MSSEQEGGASGKEVWDVICLQVRTAPTPALQCTELHCFALRKTLRGFFFYFRALPNYLYQKYLDWFSLVSFKLPLTDSDSEMTIKLQKTGWNLATSYEMMVEPLGCWSN